MLEHKTNGKIEWDKMVCVSGGERVWGGKNVWIELMKEIGSEMTESERETSFSISQMMNTHTRAHPDIQLRWAKESAKLLKLIEMLFF